MKREFNLHHRSGTVRNKGTTTAEYIVEDQREALRLEITVDPADGVQKYLGRTESVRGADVI